MQNTDWVLEKCDQNPHFTSKYSPDVSLVGKGGLRWFFILQIRSPESTHPIINPPLPHRIETSHGELQVFIFDHLKAPPPPTSNWNFSWKPMYRLYCILEGYHLVLSMILRFNQIKETKYINYCFLPKYAAVNNDNLRYSIIQYRILILYFLIESLLVCLVNEQNNEKHS